MARVYAVPLILALSILLALLAGGCPRSGEPSAGSPPPVSPASSSAAAPQTLLEGSQVAPSEIPVPVFTGALMKTSTRAVMDGPSGKKHEHIVATFASRAALDDVIAFYEKRIPGINKIETKSPKGLRKVLLSNMLSTESTEDLEDMAVRCNINITREPGAEETLIVVQADRLVENDSR